MAVNNRVLQAKQGFLAFMLFFMPLIFILLTQNVYSATTIHGTLYDLSLNKVDNAVIEINTEPKQRMVSGDGTYSFILENGEYTIKAWKGESIDKIIAVEKISVSSDEEGSYIFDMFLTPSFEIEDDVIEDITIDTGETFFGSVNEKGIPYFEYAIYTLVFILFGVVIYIFLRLMKRQEKKKFEEIKEKETKEINKEDNRNTKDNSKEGKNSENKTENKQPDKNNNNENEKQTLDKYSMQILDEIKKEDGRTTQKDLRKIIPLSEAKISLVITELENKGIIKKIKKGRGNIITFNEGYNKKEGENESKKN